jgi:hypothetical protein
MSRGTSSVTAGELQVVLTALAIVIWAFAAFNSFSPGMYYRTGPFKGADFVHFYVLGNLGTEGRADLLYDGDAQRAMQSQLAPISRGYWFIPVYGPQTALLFAGLAKLPYLWAALTWGLLTVGGFVACVWAIWRSCPSLRADDGLMLPAALGFIPLYVLATSGQTSILPLACLTAGYVAFRSNNKWWAGVALGSLVIKPHFGIAAAVVMVASREWRVVGGAILAVVAQWGLSALVLGTGPLVTYFGMLRKAAGLTEVLEPRMELLHSLRAFWLLLLPSPRAASVLYVLSSAVVLFIAARIWRRPGALESRYSSLVLATMLVSPHLGFYDLILVAPALVLTAAVAERAVSPASRRLRVLLFLVYVVPMTQPLTALTHLQLSVPVFLALLAVLYWMDARRQGSSCEGSDALSTGSYPEGHEYR